jgi:hypothetical protein
MRVYYFDQTGAFTFKSLENIEFISVWYFYMVFIDKYCTSKAPGSVLRGRRRRNMELRASATHKWRISEYNGPILTNLSFIFNFICNLNITKFPN